MSVRSETFSGPSAEDTPTYGLRKPSILRDWEDPTNTYKTTSSFVVEINKKKGGICGYNG